MEKSNLLLRGLFAFALAVSLSLCSIVNAQNRITVTGTVTDEKNESLPSVTIRVKGGATGTLSDMNGNFSITVPGENTVLVFSYVGYTTKEIKVGGQRVIKVNLSEDAKMLNAVEVVAIGYGAVSKEKLSGMATKTKCT